MRNFKNEFEGIEFETVDDFNQYVRKVIQPSFSRFQWKRARQLAREIFDLPKPIKLKDLQELTGCVSTVLGADEQYGSAMMKWMNDNPTD